MVSLKNNLLMSLPFRPRRPDPAKSDSKDEGNHGQNTTSSEEHEFFPSVWDVLKVRYLLQWKITEESLPTELVDEIIDAAEYWPSTLHHMRRSPNERRGRARIGQDCDAVLFKTVPLCYDKEQLSKTPSPKPLPHRDTHPCRKIVFNLSSHDQGGGPQSPDMYQHESWTWFDTEVVHEAHTRNLFVNGEEQDIWENEQGQSRQEVDTSRFPLLPGPKKLQVNGGRVSEQQHREIIWHYLDDISADSEEAHNIERTKGRGRGTLDGSGVRDLEIGDSIAVWARARFPGWANNVFNASARVFWAI